MNKYLVRLNYTIKEEQIDEIECTRYAISPIGAEGFLYLEDEITNSQAYVCLQKILRMTVVKLVNESQGIVKDKSTMALSAPLQITKRVTELYDEIGIGDQIAIGHYTATCHKLTDKGALFIMDQYDDDPQRMNDESTNEGGYEKSDLRRRINSEESLKEFPEDIRSRLVPFENGDLIRIPTVCEMFGHKECEDWCEDDGAEQLPLMVSRANRVAYRKNECEWGWLQNKITASATNFAYVGNAGAADHHSASYVAGVRRAFLIK